MTAGDWLRPAAPAVLAAAAAALCADALSGGCGVTLGCDAPERRRLSNGAQASDFDAPGTLEVTTTRRYEYDAGGGVAAAAAATVAASLRWRRRNFTD